VEVKKKSLNAKIVELQKMKNENLICKKCLSHNLHIERECIETTTFFPHVVGYQPYRTFRASTHVNIKCKDCDNEWEMA